MPWCEQCAKFWTPSSMTPEGACPTCGRVLPKAEAPAGESGAGSAAGSPAKPAGLSGADLRQMAGEDAKAPWHFKLMVVALVLYLSWRVVDLVLAVVR